MLDASCRRSTARRRGRAGPLSRWSAVVLGLCTLLVTSLSPASVEGHRVPEPENTVGVFREPRITSTLKALEATLTPKQTPESKRDVRRLTATGAPSVTYSPQEVTYGEPTPPPDSPEPPQSKPADCDSAPMSSLELDLFDSINHERMQQGLTALRDHPCGRSVAEVRAVDLATRSYFSHESPDGETATSLLRDQGMDFSAAGENLARNNYPVDRSVNIAISSLMDSELHRGTILGSYTHLAVASVEDDVGMKYYVMIFLRF